MVFTAYAWTVHRFRNGRWPERLTTLAIGVLGVAAISDAIGAISG
jgi:hypothetical protein